MCVDVDRCWIKRRNLRSFSCSYSRTLRLFVWHNFVLVHYYHYCIKNSCHAAVITVIDRARYYSALLSSSMVLFFLSLPLPPSLPNDRVSRLSVVTSSHVRLISVPHRYEYSLRLFFLYCFSIHFTIQLTASTSYIDQRSWLLSYPFWD